MNTELPNNIKRIIDQIAGMAAGYASGLKWNEVDQLKSDMMLNRSKWTGFTPEQIRQRCIEQGMTLKDAAQVSDLVERAQQGRRFQVKSTYKGFKFQHNTEPLEDETKPTWSKYPTAITSNHLHYPKEAQRQAIEWAKHIQSTFGGQVVLTAPLKSTLENMKGELVDPAKAGNLHFQPMRGAHSFPSDTILIALCPTRENLEQIHRNNDFTAVCVIPWQDKDVEDWVNAESPQQLGDSWQAPSREDW